MRHGKKQVKVAQGYPDLQGSLMDPSEHPATQLPNATQDHWGTQLGAPMGTSP